MASEQRIFKVRKMLLTGSPRNAQMSLQVLLFQTHEALVPGRSCCQVVRGDLNENAQALSVK